MTETTSKKIFRILSGCTLLLFALMNLFQFLGGSVWSLVFSYRSLLMGGYLLGFVTNILFLFSIVFLSIMIFLSKNKGIVISLSVIFAVKLYITICDFPAYDMLPLHIGNIFSLSSTLILILLASNFKRSKEILAKLWFLPAILEIIYLVIVAMNYGFLMFQPYLFLFKQIIYCAFVGFLGFTLVAKDKKITTTAENTNQNYHKEQEQKQENISDDGYCDMTKHVLLLILIGCIWQYVWIYRTTNYLNRTPNEEKRDPVAKLLLCMFVPFYYIYWVYQTARRVEILAKRKNVSVDGDIVLLSTVLSLFVGIIPPIILQSKINQICKVVNTETQPKPEQAPEQKTEYQSVSNADNTNEIRNFKKLLDDGIITEEEFEAKKKQLLGL